MKLLCLLLLLPLDSYAIFTKLYQGYKNSNRLKEISLNQQFSELDYSLNKNKYDWNLFADIGQTDSSLQNLFSFSSQRIIKNSKSLGISKDSFKYGSFQISHEQTEYDLSNWSSGSLNSFNSDKVYEAKNVFSYTYEILNDSNGLDWEIIHLQNKAENLGNKWTEDQDHLDFYNAYLGVKHQIMLDRLYKEFKAKARKRVRLIRKRVKDGLSRSVDLNQANLALLNQEEQVLKNRAELRSKVAAIEEIIKIPIPESRYKEINWTYKEYKKYSKYLEGTSYTETERLKLLNKINEMNISKYDESIGHSLGLSLSYAANAFDDQQGTAVDDSLSSTTVDKAIALTYSIPLGLSNRSAVRKKMSLQKIKSDLSLRNRTGQLDVKVKVLNENIKRYNRGIKLNSEKIGFAEKVSKENRRLYYRGKVSFEETLRADENLINTKISFMSMMYLYESSIAELAFLNGNITSYLTAYRD